MMGVAQEDGLVGQHGASDAAGQTARLAEAALRARVTQFSAADRLTRDNAHARDASQPLPR